MENIELLDKSINSLCRTCLKHLSEGNGYDIFLMPTYVKMLSVCTSLMIEENDGLPKELCNVCYEKLQDFYEFRETCIKSDQKFKEIRHILMQNNFKQTEQIDCRKIMKNENTDQNFDHTKIVEGTIDIKLNTTKKYSYDEFDDINCMNNDSDNFCTENEIKSYELKEVLHNCNDSDGCLTSLNCSTRGDLDSCKGTYNENEINDRKSSDNINTKYKSKKYKTSEINEPCGSISATTKNNRGSPTNVKMFICDICSKRFYKNEKFIAHKRTHLGFKPWECSKCDKQYNKYTSLQHHVKFSHSEEKESLSFTCTIEGCGKSYKVKRTLREHIKKIHIENNKAKERKSYICEQCGKSMTTLAALNRHCLIHSGELPFGCVQCPKRYRTKYKLKEHMKRHNGIKNFICSICGLKKVSQHELNVHMNYHTKTKQFKCKFCEYLSGNIGNVSRHEKIVHHGIKAYSCKYCGNSFGKSETLKHHEMTHTGEKPHECELCGKRFIQMTALKTHLKRHVRGKKIKEVMTETVAPQEEHL